MAVSSALAPRLSPSPIPPTPLRRRCSSSLTSSGSTPKSKSHALLRSSPNQGFLETRQAGSFLPDLSNSFGTLNRSRITCQRTPPTADSGPLVKLAWYASEAFGKVVANFRPEQVNLNQELEQEYDQITREYAVESLRQDYDRSYFVTGEMSMGIYEEDCEFADPFVSFKGRRRFKQNVSNLGSFMEEVNLKILDWKEDEDKVTTRWRFSCVLALPWRPILAATGGTDHYFDPKSGKIYKHVERWDISPVDGLRQLVKPNPKLRKNQNSS